MKNPQENWLIFNDTHEAIIDRETWELAQKLTKTPRRVDTTGVANPLTGLVYCADCGAKMYNHRGKAGNARDWAGRPNVQRCITTDFSELTTPMINEFIDKILVHAPYYIDGERMQEVEIYLNFIGKFEIPQPQLSEEEIKRQKQLKQPV